MPGHAAAPPEAAFLGLLALRWQALGGAGRPLDLCLVRFDAAAFQFSSFAAAGIACPAAIAASVRKRQAEFFFGRLAARLALRRIDAALGDVTVGIGAAREPAWPAGVAGSITHDGRFAAAVALRGVGGVGIDVEAVVAGDALQALTAVAVSPGELDYLRTLAGPLPLATLLTLVFSAKESLYKGAFAAVGRFFDFGAARVSCLDLENRTVALTLQEELPAPFCRGSTWIVDVDFVRDDTVVTSFVWERALAGA